MTYLNPAWHAILRELRYGRADHFAIAKAIGESPFVTRHRLKEMKRERLVREVLDPRSHCWSLTDKGWRTVAAADQLAIGEELI